MAWSKVSALAGIVVATTIVAACAPSLATRQARCPLEPRDSVLLNDGPVYRDCAVEHKAKLVASTAGLNYQPTKPCSAVELELVVDALGMPEQQTVHVIRTNDDVFAGAVIASIRNWRFEPATIDKQPVRQIVRTSRSISAYTITVPAGQSPEGAASRAVPRPQKC